MRKINRLDEPDFWKAYKRKHPRDTYDDLQKSAEGIDVRNTLRDYLIKSQYGLCAYCCKQIDTKNASNEHIKPKGVGKYSKYSMDYENLIASCRSNDSCTTKKDNDYDEASFVSPLEEDCEMHFQYFVTGEIEGITDRGRYTCDLLGLNNYALIRARMAQLKTCEAYCDSQLVKDYFLTPNEGQLEPYADMVEYFYNKGYFDVEDK